MDEQAECEHQWHAVIDTCVGRPCNGRTLGRKCVKCGQFDGTYGDVFGRYVTQIPWYSRPFAALLDWLCGAL